MRDLKSDWKRWSPAERVGAVALIALFLIIYASSIRGVLEREPVSLNRKGFRFCAKRDSSCVLDRGPAWMAAPLSIDLRTRVVSAVEEEGMSRRAAANRYGVGIRTAIRWVADFRSSGSVEPRKMGNPTPPKLSAHRDTVLTLLREQPDTTIEALRHDLAERGIVVGYGSIRRFFEREGITRKKRP